MKKCGTCKAMKPLEQFQPNRFKKDGLQAQCALCYKAYQKQWYADHRASHRASVAERNKRVRQETLVKLVAYLHANPCVDCGESDPVVLDFDHVRGQKLLTVGHMLKMQYRWETIELEIEKCDVRCANCHRRKTARQFSWRKLLIPRNL